MSVQKVLLCPFHCKPRPSGISLDSPGLENIPQVPRIGAEVDQIHDARNVVSARFPETSGIYSSPKDSKLTPDGVGLQ